MKANKLASLLMAGCLMASLAVPTFAADTADITITAPEGEKVSTYNAWKILDLTTSLKTTKHPDACDGSNHIDDCYNYSYTVNGTYRTVLQGLMPDSANKDGVAGYSDAEIIDYLASMQDNGDNIRAFADSLYAAVKDMSAISSTGATFDGVAQGYYLIAEATNAAYPDSTSLVMLDTKGQEEITITSKEDTPTVVKKVKEETKNADNTNADGWQDSADYDIGDNVPFQLKATLPNNINNYQHAYKLIFHDTLDASMTLDSSSVTVRVAGAEVNPSFYSVSAVTDGSFTVTIPDVVGAASAAGVSSLSNTTLVVVDYTAKLEDSAGLGNPGQDNSVYLEFSSNPYVESETSRTAPDVVTVFTYQVVVNKIDGSKAPLKGANFKLQKWNGSAYEDYMSLAEDADATSFTFTGLDRGQYKLVETKVPAGYNKAADVEFIIEPTMPTESDDPALTALEVKSLSDAVLSDESDDALFSASYEDGEITAYIVNSTGIHLPSTGAAGTYMIYGVGALLVIGGLALVITKTRKKSEDEAVQG